MQCIVATKNNYMIVSLIITSILKCISIEILLGIYKNCYLQALFALVDRSFAVMKAFDITFNFLISSAQSSMRISQMELDSIQILLNHTQEPLLDLPMLDLEYFIQSIKEEQDFWTFWSKSKSPVRILRKTWENPFQDFCSLNTKKSSITLSELQDLVGSNLGTNKGDPKTIRKKQLKEWLKSQR